MQKFDFYLVAISQLVANDCKENNICDCVYDDHRRIPEMRNSPSGLRLVESALLSLRICYLLLGVSIIFRVNAAIYLYLMRLKTRLGGAL